MLKMLQVRIQEKGSCRFRNSKHTRFDQLREQVGMIERRVLLNLIKAQQPIKPIK